jgi:hypothetical protein
MPLHLNDEEMSLLLSLAQPIDQRQRTQFLTEFTTAIEQEAARTSVGPSLVHRVARTVQRRFFLTRRSHRTPRRASAAAEIQAVASPPARSLLRLPAVPGPPPSRTA